MPTCRYELEAWFTYLDFDRNSLMSLDDFAKGIQNLKEFSASHQLPKQYTSYDLYHTHWTKHVRVDYELQNTLKAPLTTQQEVG